MRPVTTIRPLRARYPLVRCLRANQSDGVFKEYTIFTDIPLHQFDDSRAAKFRSRRDFTKTAILVRLTDPDATVTIQALDGPEVMKGPPAVIDSEFPVSGRFGCGG